MTYSKELTLEEATAYPLEQTKYIAPPNHPILGASLLTSSEVQKLREINTQKNSAGEKAKQ